MQSVEKSDRHDERCVGTLDLGSLTLGITRPHETQFATAWMDAAVSMARARGVGRKHALRALGDAHGTGTERLRVVTRLLDAMLARLSSTSSTGSNGNSSSPGNTPVECCVCFDPEVRCDVLSICGHAYCRPCAEALRESTALGEGAHPSSVAVAVACAVCSRALDTASGFLRLRAPHPRRSTPSSRRTRALPLPPLPPLPPIGTKRRRGTDAYRDLSSDEDADSDVDTHAHARSRATGDDGGNGNGNGNGDGDGDGDGESDDSDDDWDRSENATLSARKTPAKLRELHRLLLTTLACSGQAVVVFVSTTEEADVVRGSISRAASQLPYSSVYAGQGGLLVTASLADALWGTSQGRAVVLVSTPKALCLPFPVVFSAARMAAASSADAQTDADDDAEGQTKDEDEGDDDAFEAASMSPQRWASHVVLLNAPKALMVTSAGSSGGNNPSNGTPVSPAAQYRRLLSWLLETEELAATRGFVQQCKSLCSPSTTVPSDPSLPALNVHVICSVPNSGEVARSAQDDASQDAQQDDSGCDHVELVRSVFQRVF